MITLVGRNLCLFIHRIIFCFRWNITSSAVLLCRKYNNTASLPVQHRLTIQFWILLLVTPYNGIEIWTNSNQINSKLPHVNDKWTWNQYLHCHLESSIDAWQMVHAFNTRVFRVSVRFRTCRFNVLLFASFLVSFRFIRVIQSKSSSANKSISVLFFFNFN